MKLIKAFLANKFEVEMYRDNDGMFYVVYSSLLKDKVTNAIADFHMASYIFDMKISELGGN